MPKAKPNPDMVFSSDSRKTANRARTVYRRKAADAAARRASAEKQGAEGPKKSKPGGYSASYPKPPAKKKYRA